MARKKHNIPRGDDEFGVWFKNLIQYVRVKTGGTSPEWTHIPEESMKNLEDAYDDWSKRPKARKNWSKAIWPQKRRLHWNSKKQSAGRRCISRRRGRTTRASLAR